MASEPEGVGIKRWRTIKIISGAITGVAAVLALAATAVLWVSGTSEDATAALSLANAVNERVNDIENNLREQKGASAEILADLKEGNKLKRELLKALGRADGAKDDD